MRGLILVARRELGAYTNTSMGYVILAAFLLLEGLFFNAFAVGASAKASADVLGDFFYFSFGCTVAAALFFSMRLIAEERQTGTMVLLQSSPLANWQVVGGKFLSVIVLIAVEDRLRSVGAFSRSLMDLPAKRDDYYIINITLSYIHRQEAGSGSGLTIHTTS